MYFFLFFSVFFHVHATTILPPKLLTVDINGDLIEEYLILEDEGQIIYVVEISAEAPSHGIIHLKQAPTQILIGRFITSSKDSICFLFELDLLCLQMNCVSLYNCQPEVFVEQENFLPAAARRFVISDIDGNGLHEMLLIDMYTGLTTMFSYEARTSRFVVNPRLNPTALQSAVVSSVQTSRERHSRGSLRIELLVSDFGNLSVHNVTNAPCVDNTGQDDLLVLNRDLNQVSLWLACHNQETGLYTFVNAFTMIDLDFLRPNDQVYLRDSLSLAFFFLSFSLSLLPSPCVCLCVHLT